MTTHVPASEVVYANPKKPRTSPLRDIRRVGWSVARAPRAPIFRLAEAPELLCATPELIAILDEVSGGAARVAPPPYRDDPRRPASGLEPLEGPLGT
ncbi:hypothetical protein BH11MYX4_BH11MYX4_01430 [soil metagenome]